MSTHTTPPPAGWYSSPEHDGRQRYWDGATWTDFYVPGVAWPQPTRPVGRPASGLPKRRSSGRTAGVLVGLFALGAVVVLVVAAMLSGPGGGGDQDAEARAGAEAIAQAAEDFAGNYGYGPSVDDARPDGALAEFTDPWPTNPFTGEPMTPGSGAGDYTFYTATSMGDGQEYLGYVYVVLSTGAVYAAPYEY